jgi:copper chaperone CopZ
MKTSLLSFAAIALLISAAPAEATTSVKATVNGMVCAFCAQGIEKRISRMPATQAVFVDLKRKVVVIEAKQGQTLDAKAITAEITDSGYDVVKLETIEQSVADFKAGAKAKK